jgi:hypothetical protein
MGQWEYIFCFSFWPPQEDQLGEPIVPCHHVLPQALKQQGQLIIV